MRTVNSPIRFLNRDISILAFNERVMSLAQNPEYPLLERLRFLSIVSSNLDEFFEVRAAPHVDAMRDGEQQSDVNVESYQAISRVAHALVDKQYEIFNNELTPALEAQGIRLLSHGDRTPEQRRWVSRYFESNVRPLLVPVALDPSHPFPQVANKSLNFIVRLGGHDAFGRDNDIAIVRIPRVLPRVIKLPASISDGRQAYEHRLHQLDLLEALMAADPRNTDLKETWLATQRALAAHESDLAVLKASLLAMQMQASDGAFLLIPEGLDLALGLARAVVAIHERGILHRDIKPQNMVVEPDGVLMASDYPPGMAAEAQAAVSLMTVADTVAEGQRLFNALSDHGHVVQDYGPSFFSRGFGMVTDRYGTHWMISVTPEDPLDATADA